LIATSSINCGEIACINNQYFEFQEMQLNWSIYRAKMVLIHWLIDRAELALSVYFQICELTLYMLRNVGLSTAIANVSFS